MRIVTFIAALLVCPALGFAQEPELPSNSPAPEASPAATEPPLIPAAPVAPVLPSAPPEPEISQLDAAFKRTPLGKEAEEYRLHVEWRKLQNKIADDPELVAARKAADAAHTDLEKRIRLRAYYTLYYDRMAALASAPDLKAYVQNQKNAHLNTTTQNKVRPEPKPSGTPAVTLPKTPTPTPLPTSTPVLIP